VIKNPGIKFREIMREMGLKNGVLSYHIRKLEENGSVKIVDLKKVYFLRNADMVHEIIKKYNLVLPERTAYNFADIFSNL
jgi:predicted transcriptional regulator